MSDGELDTFDEIIYKRRSNRSFTDEDVPRQMIEKIVETGLWAPSACNLQTVHALVVARAKSTCYCPSQRGASLTG